MGRWGGARRGGGEQDGLRGCSHSARGRGLRTLPAQQELKARWPKGEDRRAHVATAGGGLGLRARDGRTREKTEDPAERGGGPR